jgi:hypothetical protein
MFKLYTRDQIDVDKWNDCINHSKQSIIYGLSWYLDIVSPQWNAYIKEENGKYTSIFPLAVNKKFTIRYIFQPVFAQQLGLFSTKSNEEKEDLKKILTLLPKRFKYIDYHLNSDNSKSLNEKGTFVFQKKVTHHLYLNKDYQTLFKAYSENHKRNIKKSLSQNFILKYSDNITCLISLFKTEVGKDLLKVKEVMYNTLLSLYTEAEKRNMCKLIFSEDIHGEVYAGALFLYYNNMIIYLFGASSKPGKKNGAMSMIFNEVIKDNAGISDRILDFEGSDIESIARFYKGFGAKPVFYTSIKLNTLPFLIKIFKK